MYFSEYVDVLKLMSKVKSIRYISMF